MKIIKRFEAVALGLKHYFTGKPCIHGHIEQRRVNDRVCMQCTRDFHKKIRETFPVAHSAKKKASYERNKKHHLAQKQVYRQANKAKVNALSKAYKVRKKNRIPKWVDKDHMRLIKEVYELAQIKTKQFGVTWHVDHIIPLQGELVSGLHVLENLQVIPGIENIKKKNNFEIDYAN